MKGTLQVAVVLVALNSLVFTVWSRAAAPPAPVAQARPTRIALVNLTYLIKNYEKFLHFQEDLKRSVEPYQDRDTKSKAESEALAKELKDEDITTERRAAIERKFKKLERKIEDNKADAQRMLVKKQEGQLKVLYMDIEESCRRLAGKRGYDIILHYNEPITAAERSSPANLARKMQAGALMPLYVKPGVDVSQEVLADMHQALKLDRL